MFLYLFKRSKPLLTYSSRTFMKAAVKNHGASCIGKLRAYKTFSTNFERRLPLIQKIDAGYQSADRTQEDEYFEKVIKWFKEYMNSPEFVNQFNRESLEIIAEATFKAHETIQLKLDEETLKKYQLTKEGKTLSSFFQKMDYEELLNFKPCYEINPWADKNPNQRSFYVGFVRLSLTKPRWLHELEYALKMAALANVVKVNSFEYVRREPSFYEHFTNFNGEKLNCSPPPIQKRKNC